MFRALKQAAKMWRDANEIDRRINDIAYFRSTIPHIPKVPSLPPVKNTATCPRMAKPMTARIVDDYAIGRNVCVREHRRTTARNRRRAHNLGRGCPA